MLLVPDKVGITFMSATELSTSGEMKTGMEVFGFGGEVTVSPSASLEETQELSMTFSIDAKAAEKLPLTSPKIEIGIAEEVEALRSDLKAFIAAGKGYLIPGCAKITKHFELGGELKTDSEVSIKVVTAKGEIALSGRVADILEISFKVAGHQGECDL